MFEFQEWFSNDSFVKNMAKALDCISLDNICSIFDWWRIDIIQRKSDLCGF